MGMTVPVEASYMRPTRTIKRKRTSEDGGNTACTHTGHAGHAGTQRRNLCNLHNPRKSHRPCKPREPRELHSSTRITHHITSPRNKVPGISILINQKLTAPTHPQQTRPPSASTLAAPLRPRKGEGDERERERRERRGGKMQTEHALTRTNNQTRKTHIQLIHSGIVHTYYEQPNTQNTFTHILRTTRQNTHTHVHTTSSLPPHPPPARASRAPPPASAPPPPRRRPRRRRALARKQLPSDSASESLRAYPSTMITS